MLHDTLEQVVSEFRLGREGAGCEALVRFLDALWVGLAQGEFNATPDLDQMLREILGAQERGDFLFVADLLDHRLRGLLSFDPNQIR